MAGFENVLDGQFIIEDVKLRVGPAFHTLQGLHDGLLVSRLEHIVEDLK